MKRLTLVMVALLLVIGMIATSCVQTQPAPTLTPAPAPSPAPSPAPAPAPPANVGAVTGPITDVGKDSITVRTDKGVRSFQVDPSTGILLNGQVCTIDELIAADAQGQLPTCTVYYYLDDQSQAIYIDITPNPPVVAIEGAITQVNPQKNTVTIQTDKGPRAFNVDPETGIILGGQICTLEELDAAFAGGELLPCTVYTTTTDQGTAVYIDITPLPQVATATGEVTSVNTQKDTITIKTDKGDRTFNVDPTTGIVLAGQVCSLDDLAAADAQGQLPPCTVYYYLDDQGTATYIDISPPKPLAAVEGVITQVNPQGTVTIQTDKGPRTFNVDPATGILLAGQVCTLDELVATEDAGIFLPCTVYYYTDDTGTAVYIDISQP